MPIAALLRAGEDVSMLVIHNYKSRQTTSCSIPHQSAKRVEDGYVRPQVLRLDASRAIVDLFGTAYRVPRLMHYGELVSIV